MKVLRKEKWKEKIPMIRVLIIGANSYIGKSFHGYILENLNSLIETSLVSASDGSWRNIDFSKFDTVLHLSAIVHKKEKKNMKKLYFEVNHRLAVNVAIRAKNSGVKQFILMSTAAIYGKTTGQITKDTVPTPNTYYGKSKYNAEKDIERLHENNFKVAIIRPPMVYGEGCKGNYRRLQDAAKHLFLLPDFHNKRSVININKLNEFIKDIVLNNLAGVYFPQDDEYFDTCRMVIEERNAMGKKTMLIPGNLIKRLLLCRITLLGKIFGDFYYCDK
jgi:UDP-glucose 4-epimerase